MNTLWKYISSRFREFSYSILSLPVAILLFAFVMFATSSRQFLPLAVLLTLTLLGVMPWIANFEIKRANYLLNTDMDLAEYWFSKPFFSWDGAKERLTSLRSWMAILYIFIAFGISMFSLILIIGGILSLWAILFAAGAFGLSAVDHSFSFFDEGDRFFGKISNLPDSNRIRFEFSTLTDSSFATWDLASYWSMGIAAAIFLGVLWMIPRNARLIATMVEGFMAGGYEAQIRERLSQINKR